MCNVFYYHRVLLPPTGLPYLAEVPCILHIRRGQQVFIYIVIQLRILLLLPTELTVYLYLQTKTVETHYPHGGRWDPPHLPQGTWVTVTPCPLEVESPRLASSETAIRGCQGIKGMRLKNRRRRRMNGVGIARPCSRPREYDKKCTVHKYEFCILMS